MEVEKILSELTLKEKAQLVCGKDFWSTLQIKRLDIPSIILTDGPHGLRKQLDTKENLDSSRAVPATAFPSASTTSCSFDKELLYKMGRTIGEECVKEQVSVILGPGLNIKRSPLCGRNFEYFSEDPLLSGKMAASFVNGVQSTNVGACLKHYCGNNQETGRLICDSIIDERALNEIYLKGFEIAIRDSNPYTMMCSYNKINGFYGCENEYTLNKILRDKFGFEGLMMTDWGAMNDRILSLNKTLDLEMPYSGKDNVKKIIKAIKKKELDEKILDDAVRHLLELIDKTKTEQKDCDMELHHKICEEVAEGSIVLLKNEENFFPLNKNEEVLMIGDLFQNLRVFGGGSSKLVPYKLTNLDEALDERNIKYTYSKGYDLKNKDNSNELLNEAIEMAKKAQKVILFIGLSDLEESEGFDRKDINISEIQNRLIDHVVNVNPNVGIVLCNGSVINLPWRNNVKGILEVGLAGEAGGRAIANVLYGDINPSGRLSETYIDDVRANPSYLNFGATDYVLYKESIYVGYRYYNLFKKHIVYPFGYGLSYTKFAYSNLKIDTSLIDEKVIKLYVDVKNVGNVQGKEVVQIYFKSPSSEKGRPERELIDFEKIDLKPNEVKTVEFLIDLNDLRYFNLETENFEFENGVYTFIVGKDSLTSVLAEDVKLNFENAVSLPDYYKNYLKVENDILNIDDKDFEKILKRELPKKDDTKKYVYTLNSSFGDIRKRKIGKKIYDLITSKMSSVIGEEDAKTFLPAFKDMPLRSMCTFTAGKISVKRAEGLIDILNSHYFKGIRKVIFGK